MTIESQDESSAGQPAPSTARSFGSNVRAAGQLIAKQAERTKIVQMNLPSAFQALGKNVYGAGTFRGEFPDAYKVVDDLMSRIKDIDAQAAGRPKAVDVAAKAMSAGQTAMDAGQKKKLQMQGNHGLSGLGKLVFEKHGEMSGPPDVVRPIIDLQTRITALDAEIGSLSESKSGALVTPKRLAIGAIAACALVVTLVAYRTLFVRSSGQAKTGISDRTQANDLGIDRTPGDGQPPSAIENTELHTTSDADDIVKKLGNKPSAEQLALALETIDEWAVKPEDEETFTEFKLQLASQLRSSVKDEIGVLQKAALDADSGKAAANKHAEAGRILSLYPMSENKAVVEEAKQLASEQSELAVRLEVIRRQRYNHWATEQIEAAVQGYNDIKSIIPYRTDRAKLMDSLVVHLGPVDPMLLEPAVLDLYNYDFDLTKTALYEQEKVDLAKQLTNPSIKRKTLGDF